MSATRIQTHEETAAALMLLAARAKATADRVLKGGLLPHDVRAELVELQKVLNQAKGES